MNPKREAARRRWQELNDRYVAILRERGPRDAVWRSRADAAKAAADAAHAEMSAIRDD